jgi:hypothetical protein
VTGFAFGHEKAGLLRGEKRPERGETVAVRMLPCIVLID